MKNNLVYKIYRHKTISKIESKIKLLGESDYTVSSFLNIRLILTILSFIIVLFLSKYGYILAPVIAFLTYYICEKIAFDYPIIKRAKKLEKEALFFFEILTLTLESGRSLKHALDLTVLNIDNEISSEFKKTLAEVKLGKSLNESLEDMKKRIPSESINNAILNMVQSNTFGSNIITSMYNEIDYLREKEILDIKASIAKLPTKISIVSIIFFVPIMLIIILAPVLINLITK